ncbi:F-box/LRR-repeat protein [Forsythia ovata]|uniref:F-box/LRR-repeat protein n=1 Tax=Forsythia ovata TaxID=205694 RepID=A0ABD1VNE5_9LAMI
MAAREAKKMRNEERETQRKEEDKSDSDNLSCLPDSILSHILSFLDTKSAIRTCVLSKRYTLVWTLLPNLDFKYSGTDISGFTSYVNHVLDRREDSIVTSFRLSVYKDVDPSFFEKCIRYAAQHKVQNLRVRVCTKCKSVILPGLLLNSPCLRILRLNNGTCWSMELPKSLALPSLKILRLKNFVFSDSNYNGEIFVGCPNLETLVLNKCLIKPLDKLKVLEVNCLKLEHLEIRYWRSPWRCFDECMINVTAPRLDTFQFQGHLVKVNFKESLLCLDKASIDLFYPMSCAMVDICERRQKMSKTFISMLGRLCNVKSLSLSVKTIEVLSVVSDLRECAPPIFENLRYIRFTVKNKHTEMCIPINELAQLLKSAKNDYLILRDPKESKIWKTKPMRNTSSIAIRARVMSYLLESCPCAENLIAELPKVSTDY